MRFVFRILSCIFVLMVMLFSNSCSEKDCVDVIPAGSVALMSVDASRMKGENMAWVEKLFDVENPGDCGLDLERRMYLFETADGNLGFCANVSDENRLLEFFKKQSEKGFCCPLQERGNINFTLIDNSWVAGFTDDVIMICGPVTAAACQEMEVKMSAYMRQDKKDGIGMTPIYNCLDTLNSPLAIVAKGTAFPENFVAPFTIGVPKDVDLSDVMITATMEIDADCLYINGTTISFDKEKDSKIKNALTTFRPLTDKYMKAMSKSDFAGFFLNIDGERFLPLLQNNKSMQALLMSVNTVVDMNNIIKSVNGDMAVVCPEWPGTKVKFSMSAQLDDMSWLEDVDYWKKSCPAGGRIADWKENSYYYSDGGGHDYYFGVTGDKQYFSGTDSKLAYASIGVSDSPLDSDIISKLKGCRLALIVNIPKENTLTETPGMSVLKAFIGGISTIIYSVR